MPRYDYLCTNKVCSATFEAVGDSGEGERSCIACGRPAKRVFPTSMSFIYPAYMKAENDEGRWRQRNFMNKPETKKKMDQGLLAVDRNA